MGNSWQKLQQEKEEGEASSSFTCEICIEPFSSNEKFKNKTSCTHPFCMACMANYIHVKVEDDNAADVKCPALACHHLLDPLACRPILLAGLFVKWCDLLVDQKVVVGFERLYCPNQECSTLIVNECGESSSRSGRRWGCPNCKKDFCFQCKSPWHAGYRCSERDEMREMNGELFGKLVEAKEWRRCPTCGHCVELVAGCSMVKCRCQTRFCYKCGRKLAMGRVCPCHSTLMAFSQVLLQFFLQVLLPLLICIYFLLYLFKY